MLHRQHNDPKLDAFRFVWPVLMVCCFAIVGALVVGLRAWRFSNFPHSIATIQEVWDQKVKGRGGEPLFEPHYETFTFGTIVFERQQKGITHSCVQTVRLGRPKDKYMAGEKLDVVPATGTCNRVDLIGRLGEQYDVSTDRED
ncbi:hypothetical protein [Agrobacterium tumefaciens]|uniref:hypothetical protein n=1 Tax=Agrobacterium tumefaciens TaxID=358 RepID=UPI001F34EF75|nr:hypothetical protein [Agrobacterium tumefaciens]WCK72362.1 hypothetical protein G6L96_014235 [Agrobacterium tumefaciens]